MQRNQCCSGSMDGTVRIWSLQTGENTHVLSGHTSLVGLLGLSPTHLVSAAADSTLRIWDPDSGDMRQMLAAHTGAITCFQHDHFKVLTGSDGTLKMWNIQDGSVIRDMLTNIVGVWQVVFEGRWCVAASNRPEATVLGECRGLMFSSIPDWSAQMCGIWALASRMTTGLANRQVVSTTRTRRTTKMRIWNSSGPMKLWIRTLSPSPSLRRICARMGMKMLLMMTRKSAPRRTRRRRGRLGHARPLPRQLQDPRAAEQPTPPQPAVAGLVHPLRNCTRVMVQLSLLWRTLHRAHALVQLLLVDGSQRCHFDFYDTFRLGGTIEITLTADLDEADGCAGSLPESLSTGGFSSVR